MVTLACPKYSLRKGKGPFLPSNESRRRRVTAGNGLYRPSRTPRAGTHGHRQRARPGLPAIEAVLVDDGSRSNAALEALDQFDAEFAHRSWRVIRQENRYLGAARNTAAAAARGEWLLFLDDDNVLFSDAVSRLVRAARFSGADCVPAASIRFSGDGDPRTDAGTHGPSIRFLGAARAWSRFRNVVGDSCALVRREAFELVGGFTEEYRVGLDDLSFFNRLIRTGHRIEPMPDPVYFYRLGTTSMKVATASRRMRKSERSNRT